MAEQVRQGPTHTTLAENLQWAAFNGYVPADDVTKRYEWHRHGNPDWWVDVRWDRHEIERHHQLYVAMGKLNTASPEAYEALLADVEAQMGGQ